MPLPNITRTTERPKPRLIIAGPAKIGKSTFAASMPKPIFVRTEDGTNGMDVDAFDVIKSFDDAMAQLRALATEAHDYETVVIDALDGLERHIWAAVCIEYNKSAKNPVANIEDIGYAKGYIFALSYWQKLISALTYLRDKGMNVCLIAHTHQRKVTPPDMEEYERYEPRIHHKALGILTEWADLIGFARMEMRTKESTNGKRQGLSTGRRLLHVAESAAYVAGNRYGIEDDLELSWAALAPLLK